MGGAVRASRIGGHTRRRSLPRTRSRRRHLPPPCALHTPQGNRSRVLKGRKRAVQTGGAFCLSHMLLAGE